MKKLIFITCFTILFVGKIFGQAQIDIPLIVTDGTININMAVGLDLTATNCIDPQLGEWDVPWWPPSGVFEARIDLTPYGCPGITSYKDYRAPGNPPAFPFTGMIEHTLWWQIASPGQPIYITYNLPPGSIMIITDNITGTLLNLGPFTGQGVATIPGSYTVYASKALLKMFYNNIGGGITQGPVFYLLPDHLNFGDVAYGQTKTLPVMVLNMGDLDSLYINNVVSSNASFTFEPNSLPLILAPGQTQMFEITYSGITGGTHIDSILFFHNAPNSPGTLNVSAETYPSGPNCEAQMFWQVIVAEEGNPFANLLLFGFDSTATDGIDSQLGESELPPFPPAGAFEARLFLPANNFSGILGSYCDFRYAVFPFSGQKEWRLAYQTAYGNTINISWDFPSYMTGVLQDIINGTFINVPMIDSGSYTVQNPYTFDRLRMLIDFNITSPVELISISANSLDNNVKLDWVTATETNNSGFEVERFQDYKIEKLQEWETIGFVPGFGTTTEPKSYSFIDENVTIRLAGPSAGIYKYRLKQIDFDGSFTYSNEIEVEVDFTPKEFVLYQNYPNPFNPITKIKYTVPNVETHRDASLQMVTLKVYDILGNEVATLVNEEKQLGVYEVEFNGSALASGMYLYKLQAAAFVQTKKMILIK